MANAHVKISMADAGTDSSGGHSVDPLTLIIFGASGDLTFRKLIPALYDLYTRGYFTQPLRIVGTGRTEYDDSAFHERLRSAMEEEGSRDLAHWKEFSKMISYHSAGFDKEEFSRLAAKLREIDEEAGTEGNRAFYFALPPSTYETAAQRIAEAGFAKEHADGNGWTRLVVEKPIGHDLETAKALNASFLANFEEHQIFRIDHFLAKEMVQNVLTFRLANAIFEPIWNRRYIDHVRITAAEKLGVEDRAGYYEESGVLRDMVQNHLMQVLAVIAIEPPARWESESLRDEKIKLFRSLRPYPDSAAMYKDVVLGQYVEGDVDGEKVPAYRDEKNVSKDSLTPTYARLRVMVDNWRWQGVPFYLTSGKRLKRKMTEAVIQFKDVPHAMFRKQMGAIEANRLTIQFQPEEKITLSFQTKEPGPELSLRPAELEFDYQDEQEGSSLDAYAKVLLDCMVGSHMLFWRQDGIEESWRFIDPVLDHCEGCDDRIKRLHFYPAGSWGPDKALRMIPGVEE